MKKSVLGIILLLSILAAAFFIRVYKLGSVPVGMTDDELRETYSALSVWKTGRGLTAATPFPFMFIVNNFSFNPVPIYLSAPVVGVFGVSMATARLPYALAGFFALVGTYMLVRRLTGRQSIALAAVFCMTFNVWAIQLSRMAYEAVFAQVFYVWGTYVFLSDWKKHAFCSVVLSMTLFFLAFNSYDAMKMLYIPLLVVLWIYKWKEIKKQKNISLLIIGSIVATAAVFVYFYISQHPTVRGSQFTIFQNTAAAAQGVELARRASSAPEFLKVLYHNKATYLFDLFLRHYTYVFSWDYLLLNQEASGIYSMWSRGNLYLVEIPLLLFGGLYLFVKKRPVFFLTLALMLVGALPAGAGPEPFTYATRASFVLPWLMFWIGAGIIYIVEAVGKTYWRIALVIAISGLYLYFIGGYFTQYYFQWPRSGAKYYSKGVEDLAAYIAAEKPNYSTVMIANINDTFFLHWARYNQTDVRLLRQHYAENPYVFDGITILKDCLDTDGQDPRTILDARSMYVSSPACHTQTPDHAIALPDGEIQWHVYARP